MVFSNLLFIYAFLPACIFLYYISPSLKIKNWVLLAASMLFYGLGEPVFILILLVASLSAFLFAFPISKSRGLALGKILLAVSVVINVSFLFVFKYVPLFVETFGMISGADISGFPKILLPIGISFYTFQILTYTVDIYLGKTPVQESFVKFLLYVSLFPQLIAGPIVRYADVEAQLTERGMSFEKFSSGAVLFVCGLCKKALLADQAGAVADTFLADASSAGTFGTWFGVIMYAFQIYFDFSGYSDMAIGLGRMFGFEFKKNFNYPYISKSVTEFWRRWHISLGTFFRDYVYIPLGGNRRTHIRNIIVVWLLTGLWHGASWNFALWGLYYGLLLLIEKYVFKRADIELPAALKTAYTLFCVLIGWVLFYFTDLEGIVAALKSMFTYRPTDGVLTVTASENAVIFAICLAASAPCFARLYGKMMIGIKSEAARALCDTVLKLGYVSAGLIICTARLVGSSFSPFLYFRF